MDKVTDIKRHGPEKIPEAHRRVLWYKAEGLSNAKIGEMLGMKEGAVSLIVNRAMYRATLESYKTLQKKELRKELDHNWALAFAYGKLFTLSRGADQHKFYVSILELQKLKTAEITVKTAGERSIEQIKADIMKKFGPQIQALKEASGN